MPMRSPRNLSASPAPSSARTCAAVARSSASWNGTWPRVKESMTISPWLAPRQSSMKSHTSISRVRHGRRTASEGRILPVLANAIAAFRHAPEWGGVLAFNEFGFGTVVLTPAPWGIVPKGEWTDHEDRLAAEWLQRQGVRVSVEVAGQAVQTAARREEEGRV